MMIEHNDTTNESDSDQHIGSKQNVQRFKVVKLVSSQPYRVGRWLCVEYTDDDNLEFGDSLPLSDDNSDTVCSSGHSVSNANASTNTNNNNNNNNNTVNNTAVASAVAVTSTIGSDQQNHNNNSELNTNTNTNTQSNTSNDNNSDERLQSVEGVAIDNKIEQAMDLVKSHLMFAVREEVDVLRERITELNARVEQLEHENALLRAHVSPETLNLLQLN